MHRVRGSPHRITDRWGQPYLDDGSQWFVPFGMRASAGNGDALDATQRLGYPDSLTRHGWTGHEHADRVGVIQMGGRLYDAEAGRFVQADPFVQDPFDGQSLNRYSYLLNNPLSGTDPSGYWGAREQGYLRTVVAIAIAVYTGYYVNVGMTAGTMTATQAAGYAALGGAASGAVATGTLRGAVTGAFTGAVGFGIGQAWSAGTWQYVAANATAGGITEELGGGRFGHGFVSAGLSASIAPQINTGNDFGDGVAYAMLGGTTSVISGGKFGNGAATGALQFAMARAGKRNSLRKAVSKYFDHSSFPQGAENPFASVMPGATRAALARILGSPYGARLSSYLDTNGGRLSLVEVPANDAFTVVGDNAIWYSPDVEAYRANIASTGRGVAGDGLDTATLDSLLEHEIGHTVLGSAAIGQVPIQTNFSKRLIFEEEKRAVRFFENPYRNYRGLPARCSYFTQGDLCP